MAKYYGKIGFAIEEETAPDVWKSVITEKYYYGDILQDSRRWVTSETENDDLLITNRYSILADDFARSNYGTIKYIEDAGAKWKVTQITLNYPRLEINVGGIYHGR